MENPENTVLNIWGALHFLGGAFDLLINTSYYLGHARFHLPWLHSFTEHLLAFDIELLDLFVPGNIRALELVQNTHPPYVALICFFLGFSVLVTLAAEGR